MPKISSAEHNLAIIHPDLLKEWHPTKNDKTPYQVTPKSQKKRWWQCSKNKEHEWEARISSRARGNGCPECFKKNKGSVLQKIKLKKSGSLAEHFPNLVEEWHPTKNDKTSYQVTPRSGKKIWWKCSKNGHEWEVEISRRTRGDGCPKCSHVKSAPS